MTTRRFASRGISWKSGPITLTREGTEFDTEKDAELIALIQRTNVGGVVVELPSLAALTKSFDDLVKQEVEKRLKVEPLSVPDVNEEKLKAAELDKERKLEREMEEKAVEEHKRKKEEATPKVIKDFKAKSPKVQAKKAKSKKKA